MSIAGRIRPDACPGALQVHEAADGPLARVRLPGGAITVTRLRELAAAAAELGSGVIELTSRANVQVRGLRSPAAFAARLAAAGLLPSPAHERVRNIVASPLGGRTALLDPQPLVEALDSALCARPRTAGLPGRFLFAVDDGTGDMPGLGADVTFVPGVAGGTLLLAGVDPGLAVGADAAASLMVAAAEAFLDEREAAGRERAAWRIGELADGPARIASRLAGAPLPAGPRRADPAVFPAGPRRTAPGVLPADPGRANPPVVLTASRPGPGGADAPPSPPAARGRRVGRVEQRDGRVALEAAAPLGRLSVAQARAIADAAADDMGEAEGALDGAGEAEGADDPATVEARGAVPVRLTPWRTVVLLDLSPAAADRATRILAAAGLVTDPASPWVGVSACTGRPGCAKALADVQEDARRWVATLDAPPPVPVHWAGCGRRCGLPRGRVVQMTATGDGYDERQQ
ncbi:precorrin-3B synthase [Nonomuraea sp. RK-328]|nr:precorrin-3B synthase [Nonomuraea sp. RK-328]